MAEQLETSHSDELKKLRMLLAETPIPRLDLQEAALQIPGIDAGLVDNFEESCRYSAKDNL